MSFIQQVLDVYQPRFYWKKFFLALLISIFSWLALILVLSGPAFFIMLMLTFASDAPSTRKTVEMLFTIIFFSGVSFLLVSFLGLLHLFYAILTKPFRTNIFQPKESSTDATAS